MRKRTAEDVRRHYESGKYVMSCYLSREDLYKEMKRDIKILLDGLDELDTARRSDGDGF